MPQTVISDEADSHKKMRRQTHYRECSRHFIRYFTDAGTQHTAKNIRIFAPIFARILCGEFSVYTLTEPRFRIRLYPSVDEARAHFAMIKYVKLSAKYPRIYGYFYSAAHAHAGTGIVTGNVAIWWVTLGSFLNAYLVLIGRGCRLFTLTTRPLLSFGPNAAVLYLL